MRHIFIIANNTFRELLRNRLLYTFVFFAVFILFLMVAVGQLSYTEQFRLTLSLGLACIHLSLIALTVFVGGSLVYRELERLTILTLLARPLSRTEFLLGKYLGFLQLMLIFTGGFFLIFYLNMLLMGFEAGFTDLLLVFIGIFLEIAVMLAATLFFSSFCASFLTVVFSLCLFVMGHWAAGTASIPENANNRQFLAFAKGARFLLPNLENFNWRSHPLEHNVTSAFAGWAVLGAGLWIAVFLTAAALIFQRRDFE